MWDLLGEKDKADLLDLDIESELRTVINEQKLELSSKRLIGKGSRRDNCTGLGRLGSLGFHRWALTEQRLHKGLT